MRHGTKTGIASHPRGCRPAPGRFFSEARRRASLQARRPRGQRSPVAPQAHPSGSRHTPKAPGPYAAGDGNRRRHVNPRRRLERPPPGRHLILPAPRTQIPLLRGRGWRRPRAADPRAHPRSGSCSPLREGPPAVPGETDIPVPVPGPRMLPEPRPGVVVRRRARGSRSARPTRRPARGTRGRGSGVRPASRRRRSPPLPPVDPVRTLDAKRSHPARPKNPSAFAPSRNVRRPLDTILAPGPGCKVLLRGLSVIRRLTCPATRSPGRPRNPPRRFSRRAPTSHSRP